MYYLMKKLPSLIIISFLIILSSCSSETIYNSSFDLPESGWYKDEAVAFEVPITDTLLHYDFGISIRNTTDYRYSNLYLFLNTEFPNGNVSRDTIECILADKQGMWLGKGWSDIKENNIVLNSNFVFPLKGKYKFYIQQAMRVDTLKSIKSIGLNVSVNQSN